MAKTKPAKSQKERNERQGDRCWDGYEPTPGKKPGTKGSCKPTAATKKKKAAKKSSSKKSSSKKKTSSKKKSSSKK